MKVFDCPQLSAEWWNVRRGIPTASEFSSICTPKKQQLAAAADSYIARLIGDRLDLLYPREYSFTNPAMRHGSEYEAEARRWYEMEQSDTVHQVGFVLDDAGQFGCSPDGLVGGDGLLELKCPQPGTQVEYLLAGVLPDEYKCQVHGQIVVTERSWVDFVSYAPGLPPFLVRVEPDAFTGRLADVMSEFWDKYMAAWERVRAMAGAGAPA